MTPSPMRPRLPARGTEPPADGMTHAELVEALRTIEGLVDKGKAYPNFHLRSRPFLHFHHDEARGTYADVRFGTGDFEPVPAATPEERERLLARVRKHVLRVARMRKDKRR